MLCGALVLFGRFVVIAWVKLCTDETAWMQRLTCAQTISVSTRSYVGGRAKQKFRSDEELTLETSTCFIIHGGNSTFINSL